ncbi:MAG: DegT/DnrJ/EryC1/StrS family aminotransferase [Candidatus Micrarchaeota archaeon]|nr:DegT/DnrJ/EryC1/StrS family aminotransferase [Candidatus Micrarchaeota archaeon]MDE1849814.1 DegT/DnrJ/EryC1/StrS family aminotransferase [Candidatus Micrarchaeota archaeon]
MNKIRIVDVRLGKEELGNITDAVKSGWISSKGKYIELFEKEFSSYIGMKYGVSSSNGTTALHLALAAVGVKDGDEVVIPTLTNIANANTVHYTGAKPVFADSTSDHWCIDPEELDRLITKRTKAIVVVHLYGHPCDMDRIVKIAEERDLYLIEDAAEAHGAEYKGRKVGTFGNISCFSFYGNKIVTTGEGGMCLTNNAELAEKMQVLRNQGTKLKESHGNKYWTDVIGFNYRMTNLQAAIGAAQIKKIKQIVVQKRKMASHYNAFLDGIDGVVTQPEMPWAKNVYWYYSILIDKSKRNRLMDQLKRKGIETRPFFYPLHMLPMYKSSRSLPVAQDLSARGINLPSSPNLTKDEIKYVCDSIEQILSK